MGIWMGHFRKGFAWSETPELEFNWHPLLMTLGMIYLYGNGKDKRDYKHEYHKLLDQYTYYHCIRTCHFGNLTSNLFFRRHFNIPRFPK